MPEDIPIQMTISVEKEVQIEIGLYDILYALNHQCTNKERWNHAYTILKDLRLDKSGLDERMTKNVIDFLETKLEQFKEI